MLDVVVANTALLILVPCIPDLLTRRIMGLCLILISCLHPLDLEDRTQIGYLHPTEFFKLMNEVENKDLVFTLETIVDKFGEEMTPYAIGLYNNLAIAFWKCMDISEADDDGDDPGALAAIGCLRAISTILESVSSIPK